MTLIDRRRFVQLGTAALAYTAVGDVGAAPAAGRKMTIDLCCGRIGVRADQNEVIAAAARHGFESVEPLVGHFAKASPAEIERLRGELQAQHLVWGAAGLPVEFRREDETFRSSLRELTRVCPALKSAGVSRVGTWVSSGSDQLTYVSNFRQHAARLREVAKVLKDHELRLGLEYVGPKTSWTSRRYPFIHTMAEMKELIAEIGLDNVGLVLDSWHWYTAQETISDLQTLSPRQIIAVDLNDAPAGRSVDQQIDNQRELPMATGVIDVGGFLKALHALGCDAPVRAEPFNARLNALPPEQALAATAEAMKKAFALIEG